MVKRRLAFWQEEDGLSLVEGLVIFPLVLLTFSAFVEFAYATFQWNQTVKALQLGARLAAVSDPVTLDYEAALSTGYSTVEGSATPEPISSPAVSICDGAAPANCDGAGLARLVTRMQAFNEAIEEDNIRITYFRNGLGYVGRPEGPVSTIRIEVQELEFNLPIMNALLGFDFTIPANPVTITSEDLSSVNGS
jgi:hypothetical protein